MAEQLDTRASLTALHFVALLEVTKGILVLLAGFGVLALVHHDVRQAAEDLVRLFHLNPASNTPRIFIDAASQLTDARLWTLAGAALAYASIRLVEAAGLWLHKPWAEWLGVVTGGIYIPIEVFELAQKVTWARMAILAVNLLVVGYLGYDLARRRKRKLATS